MAPECSSDPLALLPGGSVPGLLDLKRPGEWDREQVWETGPVTGALEFLPVMESLRRQLNTGLSQVEASAGFIPSPRIWDLGEEGKKCALGCASHLASLERSGSLYRKLRGNILSVTNSRVPFTPGGNMKLLLPDLKVQRERLDFPRTTWLML